MLKTRKMPDQLHCVSVIYLYHVSCPMAMKHSEEITFMQRDIIISKPDQFERKH